MSWRRWFFRSVCALVLLVGALFGYLAWTGSLALFDTLTQTAPGSPAPVTSSFELTIATLNVRAHPFTSERSDRLRSIATRLATMNLDVAMFQEAFTSEREELIEHLAAAGLAHAKYFPGSIIGSGLLIVSRHPIVATSFHRFSRNGSPLAVHHGDWYAGKGVAHARLRLPGGGGEVDVFTAHLIARYDADDGYKDDRKTQAAELVAFVESIQKDAPTVVAGDLNCRAPDDAYRTIVEGGAFVDVLSSSETDHILYTQPVGWNAAATAATRTPEQGSFPGTDHPLLRCTLHFSRDG